MGGRIKEDDTVRSHDPEERRYDRYDSVESGSEEAYLSIYR